MCLNIGQRAVVDEPHDWRRSETPSKKYRNGSQFSSQLRQTGHGRKQSTGVRKWNVVAGKKKTTQLPAMQEMQRQQTAKYWPSGAEVDIFLFLRCTRATRPIPGFSLLFISKNDSSQPYKATC